MKPKKKTGAAAKEVPFFARFLEGQHPGEPEARGGTISAKKAAEPSTTVSAKRMTLKYPSDSDELMLQPYYVDASQAPPDPAGTPSASRGTLKYPSDRDEDIGYYALYAYEAEVPKGKTIRAKEATVRLSKKKPKE